VLSRVASWQIHGCLLEILSPSAYNMSNDDNITQQSSLTIILFFPLFLSVYASWAEFN
jgi:hypothetical protein